MKKLFKTLKFIIMILTITVLITAFLYYYRLNKNLGTSLNSVQIEKDLFKNEVPIKENSKDTGCKNYQNNITSYKNELAQDFLQSKEVTSYIYYDINTGYTYAFNENIEMPTASVIKTALAIYIYDQASSGKTSLDKELTYTSNFYIGGSGIMQKDKTGTKYTIKKLIENSIIYSDNIAYLMLLDHFGYKNVQEYWTKQGTTTTYKRSMKWGTVTAKDGLIYMQKLYHFYREDEKYGEELMAIFKKALYRFIEHNTLGEIEIAHKSGFTSEVANDFDIIFDKNPFIYIVLTRKNGDGNNDTFFKEVTKNVYQLHRYYWDNMKCKY